MDREADSSEKGGRGSIDPLGGWGPTVLIVAGTLLTLLGVFFWGWVVQNTGPKFSLRHVPAWLIMSGFLWQWQAPRHGCSGGSWLGERPKPSDSRPVGICRNERIEASA